MIKTHIKIAFRNFTKEKFFSVINISGLCIGISVALLIALYIAHELDYDTFHPKADRIYRLSMHIDMGGNAGDYNATFPALAKAIDAEIPEVEIAVRMLPSDGVIFKHDDKVFTENDILYADSAFFDIFNFRIIAGNPSLALQKPNQVVLTPTLVRKYFTTENWPAVIGESISINQQTYEITGVVDEAPANSHFHFKAIASIESTKQGRDEAWDGMNVSTYLLLEEKAGIEKVLDKIPDILRMHMQNFDKLSEEGIIMQPIVHPLTDIHLRSNIQGEFEPNGNIVTLYIFGSVAFVVLLLASVNFVNLVTARSANRAKEVGVRKVLGSASSHLIRQFTIESIAVVFIATLLSLGVVELLRYPFINFFGKELPFQVLLTPYWLAALFLFVIVLGVLAGSYPAFFLASYKPAQVLKGKIRSGFKNSNLRNGLVTLQFVISMVLITCTLIVQHQLSFMRSKKLGFDKENLLIIENADQLSSQQGYITSVKSIANVQNAGTAKFKPIDDYDGHPVVTEDDKDNRKLVNFSRVDHDYLSVLKYEFVEGRNFSKDIISDSNAVILNQRAADFLFGGAALGKKIYHDAEYTIIGIVKDFNFESLKKEVRPVLFFLRPGERYLHVRLNPGDYTKAIAQMENIWKQQNPGIPFSYAFLDDTYNNLFKEEVKLGALFSIFTVLALFIACLGLIGLAAYMAEQRKKEISVRKVLGATLSQIVVLMSKDFARIVALAFCVAAPLAYFIMNRWLDGFAYKVKFSYLILFSGGIVVMIIAFLAVSYQAVRSALINPVDSLKEE